MDYKEMFGIDYNEDMTLENFYKVQHELPWFGFPLEDEKKILLVISKKFVIKETMLKSHS